MPRTRRYIFNTLTVVSLLLTQVAVGLWVLTLNQPKGFSIQSVWVWSFGSSIGISWAEPWVYGTSRLLPAISEYSAAGFQYETRGFYGSFAQWSLKLPHWFFTLIFAIGPTIWFIKWRKRKTLGLNICSGCSYDLTGNQTGQCPECGHTIETVMS